jgi:hypothetical protein
MRIGVDASDMIEKRKWMFNLRNHGSLEGPHVFEYKSLLNHILNNMEIKSEN